MTRCWIARSVGLTAVALFSQGPSSAAAYRTLADDDPSLEGHVRWDPATVSVALHEVAPRAVQVTAAHEALRRATSAWTSPECSGLRVPSITVTSTAATPDDGRLVVQTLRSDWRDRGFSSDVAATTDITLELRGDAGWVITDADVLVNDLDFEWSANPQEADSERRDLRSVLTHELGHGLGGLAHGCEHGVPGVPDCSTGAVISTTMYPDYLGRSQSSLASDDVAGICAIYPTLDCSDTRCSASEVCAAGECRALCEGQVCGSAMVCELGACTPCLAEDCPEPDPPCMDPWCGGGSLGDPCSANEECVSETCSDDGACTLRCAGSNPCPAGYECRAEVCVSTGAPFGATCDVPSTCMSRLCLDTGSETYCTRTCDALAGCPPAYTCEQLDRHAVCAPLRSSGCAIARGHAGTARRGLGMPIALITAALLLTRVRGARQ